MTNLRMQERADVPCDDTPRATRSDGWTAVALGLWAAAGFWGLTIVPTSNRAEHVLLYLGLMAELFLVYAFAVALARRGWRRFAPQRAALLVFGFAALFRIVMLDVGLPDQGKTAAIREDLAGRSAAVEPFLLYDNDLWRYLWDGHVFAAGVNPYSIAPQDAWEDPWLEERLLTEDPWPDVLDNVSFQSYVSVYPPLTQYLFAVLAKIAPGSVLAAKLVLIALDLLLCWVLWRALPRFGRSSLWTVAYAWNPAVVKEIAGSGHPDVLMMLLLTLGVVWAAHRRVGGAVALAAACLAKLAPLIVAPLVLRRTGALGAALFLGALALGASPVAFGLTDWWQGLRVYAFRWTFNSGPWSTIEWLAARLGSESPSLWAHGATKVALVAVLVLAWRELARADPADFRSLARVAFRSLAALVLLNPAVMPWYVLWVLPLAVLAGNRSWLAFTALAQLSYLFYIDPAWPAWWKWLEYGALAGAIVWDRRHRSSVVESTHSTWR